MIMSGAKLLADPRCQHLVLLVPLRSARAPVLNLVPEVATNAMRPELSLKLPDKKKQLENEGASRLQVDVRVKLYTNALGDFEPIFFGLCVGRVQFLGSFVLIEALA